MNAAHPSSLDHALTKADGMALEEKLNSQITQLGSGLRQEMVLLRSELRHEILQLEARMTRFMTEQLWKIMGFQAAMMGLMFAGLRTVLP